VVGTEYRPGERSFPKTGGMDAVKRPQRLSTVTRHDGDLSSLGEERPDGDCGAGIHMRTQYGKWITMRTDNEFIDRGGGKAHIFIVPARTAPRVRNVGLGRVEAVRSCRKPFGSPRSSAGFAGATEFWGRVWEGAVEALSH